MNQRLIAIGDIHGCFDSFQKLVEYKIELKKTDKLVLLGDYIDRGSQSKKVLDFIIDLQHKEFDIIPLLGNHEAMLIDAFNDEKLLSKWIQNGGSETLKSFGIKSLKEIDLQYIDFFKGLQFYYSCNNFLFVHAGFNDEIINPYEDKYHMIWTCKKEYTNPILKDKIIIHGHCPISTSICNDIILSSGNVINIDTGCVYSNKNDYGSLTALELNTKRIYFV